MRSYVLYFYALLIASAAGWKICDDVEFCRNIRNENGNPARFYVSPGSVATYDTRIEGILLNRETNDLNFFSLVSLADDTIRFIIDDPILRRHSAEVALNGEPATEIINEYTVDTTALTLTLQNNIVVINLDPFSVTVFRNNEVVVELNKNGRLVYNVSPNDNSIALDVNFPLGQRLYGIPEHAERLSLKTTSPGGLNPYRLFNVDYYGYPVGTQEALYGAIPVLYGVGTTQTAGVFWLNSAQTFVEIGNTDQGVNSVFISETGVLDIFVFTGPTLKDSVRQFTQLTGKAHMPQYFTLGYHQSRYSYMSQSDVETVVAEFDNHDFPLDVMWLDIDYTDGYKYFTWNYNTFPNPVQMQNNLVNTGRKMVAIIDPHKKVEVGYHVFDHAKENRFFVQNPDGSDFEGICWPGLSSYVDFFNPQASEWYSTLYSLENWNSTTLDIYVWNDMNEPSVFEIEEQTMPGDLQHYDGWQHKDLHNLYGFKHTEATHRGLLARNANRRPFILTRSHFAGSQRFTAMWTGDNNPTWEHFQISVPMLLTESLAGMVFCGCDIGGFTGNVEDELLQRWYQAGAWYPFYRGHSASDTDRREPYLFSEEIQTRIRSAMRQRYAHIPYWYTQWFFYQESSEPLMRPLSFEFPEDENTLDIDDQWFVGPSVLVSPVMEQGVTTRRLYLPGGSDFQWINIQLQQVFNGGYVELPVTLDSVPVFYRSGHVVLTHDDPVSSTEFGRDNIYTANIFCGSEPYAVGHLYRDDFESFDYENGIYTLQYIEYECLSNTLTVKNLNKPSTLNGEGLIKKIIVYKTSELATEYGFNVDTDVYDVEISSRTSEKVLKLY